MISGTSKAFSQVFENFAQDDSCVIAEIRTDAAGRASGHYENREGANVTSYLKVSQSGLVDRSEPETHCTGPLCLNTFPSSEAW